MANAYLINAMYGPQPTTPTVKTVEGSSDDCTQRQYRTPLAEKLFGCSSSDTTASMSQVQSDQKQDCIIKGNWPNAKGLILADVC